MLADKIFNLVMLSMCISTISLTITKSNAFSFLRQMISERSKKLGALFSCSYCMSHWAAIVFVVLLYAHSPLYMVTNNIFIDITITIFAVVSLATIITGAMYFVIKRM